MKRIWQFLSLMALCVAFLFCVTPAWGQATTSLRGVVTDPSNAAVPNATVHLVNTSTNLERAATTDTQGNYTFVEVIPGAYELVIEKSGFARYDRKGLQLLVNLPATVNVQMKLGSASQTVTVTGRTPLLNTQDASLGNAFTAMQMTTLPFEGRDPVSILSLQAGVVYTGSSTDPSSDSRSGAVSGARSDQTDITVDGVDDNDPVRGYAFEGALRFTLDSLEEFRVTTSSANADAGRSSGAQVALVTKSGTNNFHGSLYEYNRSRIGQANDWFIKRSELEAGQPNIPPQLIRNTYGASIGGPIVKNRLFFFAAYEGQSTRESSIVTQLVPTDSLRKGFITYPCDGADPNCPANGQFTLTPADIAQMDPNCGALGTCPLGPGPDPAVEKAFQGYPLPNNPSGGGDGLNIGAFTFASRDPGKLNTSIVKLDYNITRNGGQRLFVRGNLQDDRLTTAQQFPGQPANTVERNNGKGIALGYMAVISNTLINSFRYGYIRQSLGQAGLQTRPFISFYSGIASPQGETPTINVQVPVHNFVDDISWVKGKHTLRFGGNLRIINDLRQSNAQSFFTASVNPTWLLAGAIAGTGTSLDPGAFGNLGFPAVDSGFSTSYDSAVSSLVGMVPEVSANYQLTKNFAILPQGAMVPRHFRSNEAEWYAQDAWSVTPNLKLTFGLRYTLLQPPYETTGTQAAPSPGLSQWFNNRLEGMLNGQSVQPIVSAVLSGQANGKPPIWAWDYRDVAPRFAFAWSPSFSRNWLRSIFGEPGKSSIRGGYGIYYDHFGEGVINTFDRQGSFGLTVSNGSPAGLVSPDSAPRLTSLDTIPLFSGPTPVCSTPPCPLVPPAPHGGFPFTPPSIQAITWGLDDQLKTPYSDVVDLSVTRELRGLFVVEASYVGRFGNRLLQQEDMAQPMDLRDPKSGMNLYRAARMFTAATQAGVPVQSIGTIPYWENLFPGAAGPAGLASLQSNGTACAPGTPPANPSATQNMYELFSCNNGIDMTTELLQADWYGIPSYATVNGVTRPFQFWDPQWSSLYAWRTIGNSSYNALQVSLRRRLSSGLQFDLNYTYSKSIDIGSDAERVSQYEGQGFASPIINAWSPNQLRAPSDFDLTHQFNADWIYELPVGQGKPFATHGIIDAVLGNWQLSGIFRITSGFPTTVADGNYWPTNWENSSMAVLVGPKPESGTFMVNGSPNIFKDPAAAIKGFRFAYPGESGERNNIRGAGYFGLDMGLGKVWKITRESALRFSWETFNVTNAVRFDAAALEPLAGSNGSGNLSLTNSSGFGYYTSTLTKARVMQFALRYSF